MVGTALYCFERSLFRFIVALEPITRQRVGRHRILAPLRTVLRRSLCDRRALTIGQWRTAFAAWSVFADRCAAESCPRGSGLVPLPAPLSFTRANPLEYRPFPQRWGNRLSTGRAENFEVGAICLPKQDSNHEPFG